MNFRIRQLMPGINRKVSWRFFAVLLLLAVGCRAQEEPKALPEKFDLKKVSIKGINISYIDEGDGEPIVLVHGSPTSSFLWRHMIKELSGNARVIALDLPGFGFSDPPPNGDYSISHYSDFLESFIDALSIKEVTLVCHDMGGPYTLYYALHHPEKYNRLVILDTFLHSDLKISFSMKMMKIRPVGEMFLWLGGNYLKETILKMGVMDKSLITKGIVNRYCSPEGTQDKLNTTMLETLRVDIEEEMTFIEQRLKNIEKPTLILWADKDEFLPYDMGERIHKDIKGSKMVTLKDCGHFIQEEQPKQAAEIILQFLNKPS